MEPHITAMLLKEQPPENIDLLKRDLLAQLKYSRGKMTRYYDKWDRHLAIFRGDRMPDEQDLQASMNDEPKKMIVPMTHTQVMTFVTFAFLLFKQNDRFFTLQTRKNSDYDLLETGENLLDRDLQHNGWWSKVFQNLLDISRMGVCATKTVWAVDTMKVKVNLPPPQAIMVPGPFGLVAQQETISSIKDIVKYEGNKVIPVSPYCLIPDMRMPLTRWKEGRFMADEQEYHITVLKNMEKEDLLAGTQYLRRMDQKAYATSERRDGLYSQVEASWTANTTYGQDETDFMCLTTEGHFMINPSKYGLSDEDYDCPYIIGLGNDQRIIRIEKAEYMHGESIYDVAQFLPDVHAKLNLALTDTVDALQNVITWLINSRILSVRRGLETHAVVDPSVVDTATLGQRDPIFYLRKGAPRTGIDKFFMQLKYVDPTTSHMQDADILMKIMQTVTGVNENAMGQYAPGRRSATENRAANAGAASRMMLHASIMYEDLYQPLGRKMHTNLRQGLSYDTFVKVIGESPPNSRMDIDALYGAFCPADITTLVGSEDFFMWDGTTSNERGYIAQSLQELVMAMMSNPETIPMLGYDPSKLIDQIQYYRGVRNLNRFKLGPPANNALGLVPPPGPGQLAGPPVGGAPVLANPAVPLLSQGA